MPASFPVINGTIHDFGSIEFEVNAGLLIVEVDTINYNNGMTSETVYGANAQPIGETRGQYAAAGNVTFTKRGAQKLRDNLGEGWLDAVFNVRVKYADTDGDGPIVDELRGVRLRTTDNAHSQGSAALKESFDMKINLILWNGVAPIANMVI